MTTLSEFYEEKFVELRINTRKLNPKTRQSYEVSIGHWKRITGDPPIETIDDLTCARFLNELGKKKGKRYPQMAAASLQKHCNQLQAVMNLAGPRTSAVRRGQGLITNIPFFELPKVDKKRPKEDWTMLEVRAMYANADAAIRPLIDGVTPGDWWRSFICIGFYTAFRVFALTNTCYTDIDGDFITARDEVSKGNRGMRQFLHPEAKEHAERIRSDGRNIILLYPDWEKKKRVAYDNLRKIQTAAGIPEARQWAFHSFRKTHTTQLARFRRALDDAIETAQRSAGHSDSAITRDHYVSGDLQDELMAEAIMKLPSPCGEQLVTRKVEVPQVEPDRSYANWMARLRSRQI